MGCDIHIKIEVKADPYDLRTVHPTYEGFWVMAGDLPLTRNYALFAIMADVRNHFDPPLVPISQPRGLPDDISGDVEAIDKSWEDDNHSHSWLTIDEVLSIQGDGGVTEAADKIARYMEAMRGIYRASDVRIVFWFDN